MNNSKSLIVGIIVSFLLGQGYHKWSAHPVEKSPQKEQLLTHSINQNTMRLGAFSISLNVKDIRASKLFYENLGFITFGGSLDKNYLIMKNGKALIGLFQGMFPNNILTFNPGWDENAQNMKDFDDIREIQKELKRRGVKIDNEVDENTTGPASLFVVDPDGNAILLDQHR